MVWQSRDEQRFGRVEMNNGVVEICNDNLTTATPCYKHPIFRLFESLN